MITIFLFVTLHKNFCKVCYSVCLFVCLQHNSKTTAQMIKTFLESIRTVTRKNSFEFGHDRVNIFDSGEILQLRLHRNQSAPPPNSLFCM